MAWRRKPRPRKSPQPGVRDVSSLFFLCFFLLYFCVRLGTCSLKPVGEVGHGKIGGSEVNVLNARCLYGRGQKRPKWVGAPNSLGPDIDVSSRSPNQTPSGRAYLGAFPLPPMKPQPLGPAFWLLNRHPRLTQLIEATNRDPKT